jgi:membrane-bound lytic murein transglycosylase F
MVHEEVTMPKIKGDTISGYDDYFKEAAKKIGWDWRLLAALSYQESNFNPSVVSRHGAFGLMQLMPETALKYGCDSTDTIVGNINAGALLIEQLDKSLRKRIKNKDERIKFILAAYNAGLGHVLDAIEIAQYNKTPDSLWFNHVENDLLLKAQKEYYTLPGVKSGYCRCHETYHFVHRVLSFYDHFKTKVK